MRESRERVRAAIQNAQLEFPQRRITVNLAPADLPKEGSHYDLPIDQQKNPEELRERAAPGARVLVASR